MLGAHGPSGYNPYNDRPARLFTCLVKSPRMPPPKPIYSYLSAAALGLITVATFYVFQNFGPQSVIRRFHIDVARSDRTDLSKVTVEPLRGDARAPTDLMVSQVAVFIRANASYEIVSLKRSRGSVQAAVAYELPDGREATIIWVVRQFPTDWRVDCRATLQGMFGGAGAPPGPGGS